MVQALKFAWLASGDQTGKSNENPLWHFDKMFPPAANLDEQATGIS